MIKYLKELMFAWHYKQAVRKAVKLSKLYGMKYMVIYLNGGFKVVSKKRMRELIATHRLKKGVTIRDIENKALFITH